MASICRRGYAAEGHSVRTVRQIGPLRPSGLWAAEFKFAPRQSPRREPANLLDINKCPLRTLCFDGLNVYGWLKADAGIAPVDAGYRQQRS